MRILNMLIFYPISKSGGGGDRLTAFFSWSARTASALRPKLNYSYTNNWPPEPLVGNHATADAVVWSVLSLILEVRR